MSRLILVSHRLPVAWDRRSGLSKSSGGLVAALAPLHRAADDALWVGALEREAGAELSYPRLVPVRVPEPFARRHYEGFSNGVLWPLFHYLLECLPIHPADSEAYRAVNERFADAVLAHARPDDTIWIHDYHLMLLPALLRARLPEARIGFFLHVPFPSTEVFRILPAARSLLEGLREADLVGLQTEGDALNLADAFRRILGISVDERGASATRRQPRVGAFPIGVDARALAERAGEARTTAGVSTWRRRIGDRKVILGVDRMDYTKGLPLRLEAYRRLLESEARWRDKVVFIQIAVPSRTSIPRYARLKEDVERAVGEISGRFGIGTTDPIRYVYGTVTPHELSALYRLADVAMVTPVRDGMNLVAKEYVASRLCGTGVVVLSEFAGAAAQMQEALLVNPWDVEGTARTLHRALGMDEAEQRRRMSALGRSVMAEDVHLWTRRFLGALDAASGAPGATAGRRERSFAPAHTAEGGPTWQQRKG